MIDFLKRQKLQRQGYSCGKKRREHDSNEWFAILRTSVYVRWLTIAGFICALGVLVRYYVAPDAAFHVLPTGLGMAAMLALLPLSLAYFKLNFRGDYDRNSRFFLVHALVLLHLTLLVAVWKVVQLNELNSNYALLLAPMAFAPMMLTLLLGKRHGTYAVLFVTLWSALLAPWAQAMPFAVVSAITGLVGAWSVRRLRRRSELMRAGVYTGLAGFLGVALLQAAHPVSGGLGMEWWQALAPQAGANLLTGIFTAMLVGGMLPVLEAVFRITTTISWIELSDLNHPLLRRMTIEAPGTYHHSLMVANLSEAAAEAVGADATICRVCSYFHDIGKLVKPEYCIENIGGGENPHNDLTPSMSALVVIAHVKDGVDLSCRHKLNREIIDVIQQHHGTSLVYYFYRRALDQQEEMKKAVAEGRAAESDIPEVKDSSFRYPGPKPSFRESAIVSLADAVESASRALTKPTPQKIEALVEDIIRGRLRDGQLDECDLTLRELNLVRESFTKTLRTSLHRRIPYPDEKEEKREDMRTATDRTEYGERYERPDRTRTAARTATSRAASDVTATNIIRMPGAGGRENDRSGKTQ